MGSVYNSPFDELRAAVERHHEAGKCAVRWRNDVRTAINALQRYAPDASDLVEIEAACERYRTSAPVVSEAARRDYSGRVRAAINLHRGAPTERWPDGAQVRLQLKLPSEMRAAVRALAEERGCAVLDVIRAAIQAELDAHPVPRAVRARPPKTNRRKTARIS